MSFKVLSTGPQALFQDRGRFGFASSGVSSSGVFDRAAAARANYAVGNLADATVIEVLLGGFELEALHPATVIFCGAQSLIKVKSLNGPDKDALSNTIIDLEAGDRIFLNIPDHGMRSYLAVRGGFKVEKVLGSASSDLLSHIGPAPLQAGDELHIAQDVQPKPWWPTLRHLPLRWPLQKITTLEVVPGPRADWFSAASQNSFYSTVFEVSQDSNRIGIRLNSANPLERVQTGELKSEGMVRGSIQVPPGGHPVIFGADHPVTGGYPVIAVITAQSSDLAAQLAPGDKIRFSKVTPE
ncbi:biotin-dependent carboxyltransferase family protein [Corynebacterium callunae]|uniref:5-oxoprolinase subunit C family protein n=1 Tax=Corynebacterium callunae TaxID=1721 RepID=UPI001FFFEE72|nr:biotin-dependent carboxyltransferase family protein [Corynebacterium callunae]MCK2201173.1 biotin-dependent carboxyltransferase family protein [Corynebacterium callunae]